MRRRWLMLVVALCASVIQPVSAASPGGAAASAVTFSMTTFRDLAVDPGTGRVFVAGDDKVVVFNPDGSLLTTITSVFGAGGLAIRGDDLFVTETTAGAIARVSISTSSIVDTFTLVRPVGDSLAVLGGKVWFTSPTPSSTDRALAVLDPATRKVEVRTTTAYNGAIAPIPGSSTDLLFYDRGLSPYGVTKYDVSVDPPLAEGSVPFGVGSNLREVAVGTGGRFWAASGYPYAFPEFSVASMGQTGVYYPGTNYPNAIAHSPARGGIVVGAADSTYGDDIFVAIEGRPVATHVLATPQNVLSRGVDIAPDASKVYAVVGEEFFPEPTKQLFVAALAPTVTSSTPSHVIAGVPAQVTVSGQNLGAITSVSVGGLATSFDLLSPTSLRVDVPPSLAPGRYSIGLRGPFGRGTARVSVDASTGGTLTGTIRAGATPVKASVTLSGGGLPLPMTMTTGAGGAYSFTGVPYGTDYELLVRDVGGPYADRVAPLLTVIPSSTTAKDVDLAAPAPAASTTAARVVLPPGPMRDVELEPLTGRVFATVGDRILAYDAAGRELARFEGEYGAKTITVANGQVYVNVPGLGQIVAIDAATLQQTDAWTIGFATDGTVAFGGGRLWFTDGNDQWVGAASLDPTTGAISRMSAPGTWYVPHLRSVPDDPARIVLFTDGLSPGAIEVLDVSGATPQLVASDDHGAVAGTSDLIASKQADRIWPNGGEEFTYRTVDPSGVLYPEGGDAVAYSPSLGGVLAIGASVYRVGVPAVALTLASPPGRFGLSVDTTGDTVYSAHDGELVISDLRPRGMSLTPVPLAGGGTVTLGGRAMGPATEVLVDDVPVPFTVVDQGRLAVTLPALSAGAHSIRVTTPWDRSPDLRFWTVP